MFTAYFDAGGAAHRGRVLSIAGFVSDDDTAIKFQKRFADTWGRNRHEAFLGRLPRYIDRHIPRRLTCELIS